MKTTDLTIIDVKIQEDRIDLLDQIEQDASLTQHRNSKNYINLKNNLDNFLSYELLVDRNSNVIASSGLQKYQDRQCRVASRTYTVSKYRKSGGSSLQFSENIFLPYEIEVAKKHDQRLVFFSIELLRRRNSVNRFCRNLNNLGMNFKIHPNMINTCRQYLKLGIATVNEEQSCWQNAAYLSFDGSAISLPTMDVSDYRFKFYSAELSRLNYAESK